MDCLGLKKIKNKRKKYNKSEDKIIIWKIEKEET